MKKLKTFGEFLNEGEIESVNESTFGIKTDGEAAIKGLDSLTKDLDGAKIKYKISPTFNSEFSSSLTDSLAIIIDRPPDICLLMISSVFL